MLEQIKFKERLARKIVEFKARNGIDGKDHHLISAMHLMNYYRVDKDTALDQTSFGANDSGIDSWRISPTRNEITAIQSKQTDVLGEAIKGLKDLKKALDWLESVIVDRVQPKQHMSPSLQNLWSVLCQEGDRIDTIQLVLLTCALADDVTASKEMDALLAEIPRSRLNKILVARGGSIDVAVDRPNLTKNVPKEVKRYEIAKIEDSSLPLSESASLAISYVPLISLVRLYEEMGNRLFNKNVRLSLLPFADSRNRVANPMEKALESICKGDERPEVFAANHVGVTISAANETFKTKGLFDLEEPSVVNGCQTITVAAQFYRKLIKNKAASQIERFSQIKVVAKVVIGLDDQKLKEVTNSNNRQNPIENWQLFSNDEIHFEIEAALKQLGVFYERQRGKFMSVKSDADEMEHYPNTSNTHISIPLLAQVVCLCQGKYAQVAKQSLAFTDKEHHDAIFGDWIIRDIEDVVLLVNLFRAAKCGLTKYLESTETYSAKDGALFDVPVIRAHMHALCVGHLFQCKSELEDNYKIRLYGKAAPGLTPLAMTFYRNITRKVKSFYDDKGGSEKDVSVAGRERFFKKLAIESKTRIGALPFSI